MRYIIIGAGAVGGAVGGRLAQAGHEVVLVARGRQLAVLRESGLRLRVPGGDLVLRPETAAGPEELGPLRGDDVLVLAVKTQDATAALDTWGPAPVEGGGTAAERLPLLCAQNGVESRRQALRRFRHVYGVCVWLPATFVEPGVVSAAGQPLTGILHIGRRPHGTDDTARAIAADFERAHFEMPVVDDVSRWEYAKLLSNLANALEALCGPLGEDEEVMTAFRQVQAEGRAVLDAAGIAYASPEEQAAERGHKVDLVPLDDAPRGGGSSWQSLSRATGTIEADYLNGEIVLLGRLHGVPAPLNELLQRLANRFAREHRPPGSLPVRELLSLAEEALAEAEAESESEAEAESESGEAAVAGAAGEAGVAGDTGESAEKG